MTFEDIAKMAHSGTDISKKSSTEEKLCFLVMKMIYLAFRNKLLDHDAAKQQKEDCKSMFLKLEQEHNSQRAAFAQYQENIRNAGYLISEITKGLQSDTEALTLLLKSVECICCMTGETVLLDIAKREVERRILNDGAKD